MRDLFIADAHLQNPSDANYRRLLEFLRGHKGRIRTLYLLGDIFDFWVGFDSVVYSCYVPMLQCLCELRQAGAGVVFCEGNHDFHLGGYISEELGCTVLTEGARVDLDGIPVYIAHGDLINPQDQGYRILRRVLRSRPVRLSARLIHPDWIWRIYRFAARLSASKHRPEDQRTLPLQWIRAHADACFAQGCRAVVTAHFHLPHMEQTAQGTILCLGDWINQYSYAVFENGEFKLLKG